jgi:hypothetical protein
VGAFAAVPSRRSSGAGAAAAGALLLAAYVATLAPGITLWDAGELVTAVHGLGVPHPPGTPLFVLVGRAWSSLLPGVPTALATNLLSAAATAAACAVLAWLASRWLRAAALGAAAGVTAGLAATVWRSANETEVYAVALLLAALTLLAAERAGRDGSLRSLALVAYLFALAVPLHLFALVAAPAAIALAAARPDGRVDGRRLALLSGALLMAGGAGTVRWPVAAVGALLAVGAALVPRVDRGPADEGPPRRRRLAPLALGAAVLLGVSAVVVLLVRARHLPALDQGHPATWPALLDVIARRQYAVAPLWPRQAPPWLQVGNLLEYADWQFALGLAPGPPPSWGRTSLTVVYALLGLHGALVHRRADRRSWRALLLLLLGGSLGVVAYLNLRAGPSFGDGVLPPDAVREARERDYFFTLGFWVWGAWAGVGAVAASRRRLGRTWPGAMLAVLPLALNWRAVDRARGRDATIARDAALVMLVPAPAGAVLLAAGDNDTYPLWYLQQVEGVRPDVTVVVTPLLPAAWYRAELARGGLLADSAVRVWRGVPAAVRALAAGTRDQGRPLLVSVLQSGSVRRAAGGAWQLHGAWYAASDASVDPRSTTDPRVATALRRQVGTGEVLPPSADPAARAVRRALSCAALAGRRDPAALALLASRCDRR